MITPWGLARDVVATAEGIGRFGKLLVQRVDVNHVRPQEAMDNAHLYAETGRSPVAWLGGILTDPSHHKADQLAWQQLGVPFYIADNGHGLRPAVENAATLRDTIHRALDETGSDKVFVAAQSKGCTDTMRMLLDHPEIRDHISGVFFHNGPFDGGFTTDPGKAQALRGLVEIIDGKLPAKLQGKLGAASELTHGTPHLKELRERFPQLVAEMPSDLYLTNYISHLRGTQIGGRPGHDLFIPKDSQALPAYDLSMPQAKQIEVVDLGHHNHITTHQYGKTKQHMNDKMTELDLGISQDWRAYRG